MNFKVAFKSLQHFCFNESLLQLYVSLVAILVSKNSLITGEQVLIFLGITSYHSNGN